MDDTSRLDAIGAHGLCVATHSGYVDNEWSTVWVCTYFHSGTERTVYGASIREVIDKAVLDITTMGRIPH